MMSARKPPLDRGRQRRLDRLNHPAIGYAAALTELDDPGEFCAKAHHAFQTLVDVEQMSRRQSANLGAVLLGRSEEHTSELQSLMRISYAVFCLKKKKKKIQIPNTTKKTKIEK